jgi:hypothetical protein
MLLTEEIYAENNSVLRIILVGIHAELPNPAWGLHSPGNARKMIVKIFPVN